MFLNDNSFKNGAPSGSRERERELVSLLSDILYF